MDFLSGAHCFLFEWYRLLTSQHLVETSQWLLYNKWIAITQKLSKAVFLK